MKNLFISVIIFVLFLSPAYAQGGKAYMSQVEKVIDGDTLLLINGKQVELIGIDCPEIANRATSQERREEGEGFRAYRFTQALVEGKEVRLEFDVQQKDKYGRLLAYVYVPFTIEYQLKGGGYVTEKTFEHFLNEIIIKQGYASPMTIPPNVKHADLFQKLYQEARENEVVSERSESNHKRGLWKETEATVVCPQCGAKDIVEIAYGFPSPELFKKAERGDVVLGGCIVTGDDPRWACKSCNHRWK